MPTNSVQFNEENSLNPQKFKGNSPPGLTGFVVKLGLANTAEKANYMLICVFVVTLIITFIIFIQSRIFISKSPSPDQATLERMTQDMRP